ncbi:hypothetical protein, partial [Nocardia wallacei]|uniref:hypothetical protein n=1 Tax=Nocardia wallacei TaxID=480035 RepID=UPI002453870B
MGTQLRYTLLGPGNCIVLAALGRAPFRLTSRATIAVFIGRGVAPAGFLGAPHRGFFGAPGGGGEGGGGGGGR